MSPFENGYTIYVGGTGDKRIVRLYREADDLHLHSAEGCTLGCGLREVERAVAVAERSEAQRCSRGVESSP